MNARFYVQIGRDSAALIAAGIAAPRERYGLCRKPAIFIEQRQFRPYFGRG